MTTTDLVIDALAVARLSRLVTSDSITRPWRAQIIRYAYRQRDQLPDEEHFSDAFVEHMVMDDHEPPRLAEFITCRWCCSLHIALFVVCARRLFPGVWDPLARALVASMVTGLLTRIE